MYVGIFTNAALSLTLSMWFGLLSTLKQISTVTKTLLSCLCVYRIPGLPFGSWLAPFVWFVTFCVCFHDYISYNDIRKMADRVTLVWTFLARSFHTYPDKGTSTLPLYWEQEASDGIFYVLMNFNFSVVLRWKSYSLWVHIYDSPYCVVAVNEPFPLFCRIPVGQCVIKRLYCNPLVWCALDHFTWQPAHVEEMILKYHWFVPRFFLFF